jgi:MFS family permease
LAALIFTLVITVGEILSFPFSNTYALLFSKDHNRGKYMGLYTMTFSVAHIIAPLSGLKIAELYGFNTLWIAGGLVCIVASILIMLTKMRKAQVR